MVISDRGDCAHGTQGFNGIAFGPPAQVYLWTGIVALPSFLACLLSMPLFGVSVVGSGDVSTWLTCWKCVAVPLCCPVVALCTYPLRSVIWCQPMLRFGAVSHNENAVVPKCRHVLLKLGIECGVPYDGILTPGALLRFSLSFG